MGTQPKVICRTCHQRPAVPSKVRQRWIICSVCWALYPSNARAIRRYHSSPRGRAGAVRRVTKYQNTLKGRLVKARADKKYASRPDVRIHKGYQGISRRLAKKIQENAL